MENAGFAHLVLLVFVLAGAAYILFVAYHLVMQPRGKMARSIWRHATWSIGLPMTALGAFALVWALPVVASDEALIIRIGGVEFNGPATRLTYWVIIFAVMVWATDKLRPR